MLNLVDDVLDALPVTRIAPRDSAAGYPAGIGHVSLF